MATAVVSPPAINISYNQLLAILPSYMERPDPAFAAMIPVFINLAENRLATDMKQEGFLAVVTGLLPLKPAMPKPSFWRETESFTLTVAGQLKTIYLRTLEFCKVAYPNTTLSGVPSFYADYNATNFYLAQTPDQAYPFELVYYARLDPLSPANQDNWLTLNAPQALLFACLWEAALWCKNAAAETRWQQQYMAAVGGQMTEDKERGLDRNSKNG